MGQRRGLAGQAVMERLDIPWPSFHQDGHTLGGVGHFARQATIRRQLKYKGPETHPLDDAANFKAAGYPMVLHARI